MAPIFGDRDTAGGNYERWRAKFAGWSANGEFGIALDFADVAIGNDFYFGEAAFGFEQAGYVAGGAVAKELAKRFLVVWDAMFFDERYEICWGVASESGFREMRVGGNEIFGLAVNVGEVAASSAGD